MYDPVKIVVAKPGRKGYEPGMRQSADILDFAIPGPELPDPPAPDSLYARIRQDILSGMLAANERLKVSSLAGRYQTSTNPVREALQQLRGEGLVVIEPNRGASVRRIDAGFVRDNAVLAIVFYRLGRTILGHLLGRFWRKKGVQTSMTPGIAIYQRLESLLGELGLKRSRNETPREFADRVGIGLRERFHESGLEGIPQIVVSAFYQIRFGGLDLDTDQLRRMDEKLDVLESQIRQPKTT